MLQHAPSNCVRAAASMNKFVGHRCVFASRPLHASFVSQAAPNTARQYCTRKLSQQRLNLAQSQHGSVTALQYCRVPRAKQLSVILTRHNATAAAASSAAPAPSPARTPLTWNRFLALRKTRRRINLAASLVMAAGSTAAGVAYLSQTDFDQVGARVTGMDPFIILGLTTFAFMGVGWLMGPFVGGAVFNIANRAVVPEIRKKETDLFRRITKNRADPSNSSIANPIPDYYGEKIGSVKDYRTWLRDQRAFRLKRNGGGQ